MKSTTDPSAVSSSSHTARRQFLRALAAAGAVGAVGLPVLSSPARAIPGVTIDYKRCKVVFVSNASALDAIAVYYADRDGDRQARYDIDPTTTNPRGYAPLVVEYDADENRTQIQLAEPRGGLACVIAEAGDDRTVKTNPIDACVPERFNTAPTASFDVSADPTVGEPVTFTSTATDPDNPERLSYEWDLDGDGTYEATGETTTTTYAEAGDVRITHRVTDDCGATITTARTVTVAGGETFVKLTADDAEAEDIFGFEVSIDGDTALIGAPLEDPDGTSAAGSAYVFTRSGGTWTKQQKLTAGDPDFGDQFGNAVSIDSDTAVVGAYRDSPGKRLAGAAYVFTRSGGTWTQQQKLTANDAEEGDQFGRAVSLDGDTLLVGARLEDPDGVADAGSAYVFTRSGGTWTQQQKLTANDAEAGDYFGGSVSVSGDTALIGAGLEDPDGKSRAGSAYVFTRSGGTWTQQQKLTANDAEAEDRFGVGVSLDRDTALIGAYFEAPSGATEAGSAYVFTRSGGTWTQQQKLVADDAEAGDQFGNAVSLDRDTALIGSYFENRRSGSAYVFTRSSGTWTQQQKLVAEDAASRDEFGVAVAVDGDTALVGAWREDPDGVVDAGSAYVFST